MGLCRTRTIPLLLFVASIALIIVGTRPFMGSPDHLLLGCFGSVALCLLGVVSSFHSVELLWNMLFGLLEHAHQLSNHMLILGGNHITVCLSFPSGSTCPSNSMNIIVESSLHGHIIIYDDGDVLDIKSSRCYIRGNEDVALGSDWFFEFCVDFISFPLLLIPVDCSSFILDSSLQIFVPL